MTYRVSVSITDGNNAMTCPYNPTVSDNDKLKDVITHILMEQKPLILNNFPTNQWIYQWIISSNIDGSLRRCFDAFGVTGNENLMNALLNNSSIVSLGVGNYVLSFEGY